MVEKYWYSPKTFTIHHEDYVKAWGEDQKQLFGKAELLSKNEIIQCLITTNKLLFGLISNKEEAVSHLSQLQKDTYLKHLPLLESFLHDSVVIEK